MPCVEWFEAQDAVLPRVGASRRRCKARVAVEAGIAQPWYRYVGDAGEIVSIEHFGASRRLPDVCSRSSASPTEAVVAAARRSLQQVEGNASEQPTIWPQLSDAGVSIWLDDLSRERLKTGNLAELIRDKHVVGVTTQPDDLRERAVRRARPTTTRCASWPRAAPTSRRRSARSPPPTCATRATCSATSTRRPAASTAGCRIEVDPRLAHDTDEHRRRGARPVEDRRPAQPAGQDPGHRGGSAGDHPDARRGHQRQRHADLLGRALPGRDGRLHRRPGAGQGQRPRPAPASTRSRRSSCPAWTPRSTSGSTTIGTDEAQGAARQGRRRQRAAGLRGVPGDVLRPSAGRRSPPTARNAQRPLWASTGVKNPDYSATLLRRRAGRRRHA